MNHFNRYTIPVSFVMALLLTACAQPPGPDIADDPDDSVELQLTSGTGDYGYASFSPDGTKIIYVGDAESWNADLYVMDVDGGNKTNLTNRPEYYRASRYSPDGSKIVFESGTVDNIYIYIMDADGSNRTKLSTDCLSTDFFPWSRYPQFSPDGHQIAYTTAPCSSPYVLGIVLVNVDGSGQQFITDTTGAEFFAYSHPIFSSDGTQILVTVLHGLTYSTDLYIIDLVGDGLLLIADALGALDVAADDGPMFDYSPDGALIAYVPTDGGINIVASTGGAPTVLTEGSGGYQSPRFLKSSAGELRIIYTLEAPDEEPDGFDVFIMNLDGSDNHEITDVGHNSDLAVSPDRSKVVYTKRSGGYTQIYIFGID